MEKDDSDNVALLMTQEMLIEEDRRILNELNNNVVVANVNDSTTIGTGSISPYYQSFDISAHSLWILPVVEEKYTINMEYKQTKPLSPLEALERALELGIKKDKEESLKAQFQTWVDFAKQKFDLAWQNFKIYSPKSKSRQTIKFAQYIRYQRSQYFDYPGSILENKHTRIDHVPYYTKKNLDKNQPGYNNFVIFINNIMDNNECIIINTRTWEYKYRENYYNWPYGEI